MDRTGRLLSCSPLRTLEIWSLNCSFKTTTRSPVFREPSRHQPVSWSRLRGPSSLRASQSLFWLSNFAAVHSPPSPHLTNKPSEVQIVVRMFEQRRQAVTVATVPHHNSAAMSAHLGLTHRGALLDLLVLLHDGFPLAEGGDELRRRLRVLLLQPESTARHGSQRPSFAPLLQRMRGV